MFSLFFFALGMLNIEKHKKFAIAFFFIGALFHEVIFLSLFCCGIIFLIADPKILFGRYSVSENKTFLLVCLMPALIFLTVDILHFWACKPPALLGSGENINRLNILSRFKNLIFLAGLFVIAFLFPFLVSFKIPDPFTKLEWSFEGIPQPVIYILGGILIVILLGVLIYAWNEYRRKSFSTVKAIAALTCSYMVALIGGLSVGRLTLRFAEYIQSATYYYYYSNFGLMILIILLIKVIQDWLAKNKKTFISIGFALCLLVIWQIPFGFTQIQKVLGPRFASDNLSAQATLQVANFIEKNNQYCFGGPIGGQVLELTPAFLLDRQRCVENTAKDAVYTAPLLNQTFGLVTFKPNSHLEKSEVQKNDFNQATITQFDYDKAQEIIKDDSVFLSKSTYQPFNFSVEFDGKLEHAGLVVSYQDSKNFTLFLIERKPAIRKYRFYSLIIKNGEPFPGSQSMVYYQNAKPFRLTFQKLGERFMVTFNQNLVVIFEVDLPPGKVGIILNRSAKNRFPKLFIFENKSENESVSFKPVFRLNLNTNG